MMGVKGKMRGRSRGEGLDIVAALREKGVSGKKCMIGRHEGESHHTVVRVTYKRDKDEGILTTYNRSLLNVLTKERA